MNPSSVALPYQLSKANLSLLLHLLYHLEQLAVLSPVPGNDVGSTAEDMVTVGYTPNERIEFFAAVARGNYYRLAPRFADGVEELVYEYVQQVVCTLRWAIVDALAQRGGAGGEFLDGKVFHGVIYYLTIYKVAIKRE